MKRIGRVYLAYLVIVFGYFVFFYPLETLVDSRYAAIAHAVFFAKLPLGFIYLYVIIKRNWFEKWQARINVKNRIGVMAVLAGVFLIGYRLIELPFNIFWFYVRRLAGTSEQTVLSWLSDRGLDFLFYWLGLTLFFLLFQAVVKRWRRRWPLVLWLCLIPIVFVFVYVQPIWIDPLYQEFSVLPEGELRTDIEAVANSLEIEELTLLEVKMSDKVTTYNAYVNGIFGRTQVVFWDTMLEQMEHGEIMFVFAHELGHYVMHHVYFGVVGYLIFGLLLLVLIALTLSYLLKGKFRHLSLTDVQVIPLFLVITLGFFTVTEPITLAISREMEREADRFAIAHTEAEDLQAARQSFVRLATQSKGDIDPVFWVKWLRNSHPPMKERIERIEQAINEKAEAE